jgi:phosphoribosylaminoimidazole (AIR) synthetase
MVIVLAPDKAQMATMLLKREGELVYEIGRIEPTSGEPEAEVV